MSVCLLFPPCFSDRNTLTAPVTLLLFLWESTSKCQAHPPEECHTAWGWINDEEERLGRTTAAGWWRPDDVVGWWRLTGCVQDAASGDFRRRIVDKPQQQPPKPWTTSISVLGKAADTFVLLLLLLLWYHCLLLFPFLERCSCHRSCHRDGTLRRSTRAIIFPLLVTALLPLRLHSS